MSNNVKKQIAKIASSYLLGLEKEKFFTSDFSKTHPHIIKVFEKIKVDYKTYLPLIKNLIAQFPITARIPLIHLNTDSYVNGDKHWQLPQNFKKIVFSQSPLSVDVEPNEKESNISKLENINWDNFGNDIEKEIGLYFNFDTETKCSYILFGSILWKSLNEINDIDIIVIVENYKKSTIEVGSYSFLGFYTNKFVSDVSQNKDLHLDISLIYRNALKENIFNHDLVNISTWSFINGLCLKGNPILDALSDIMLVQDIFISSGFTLKAIIADNIGSLKMLETQIRNLQIALHLEYKYGFNHLEKLNDLLNNLKGKRNYNYTDFISDLFVIKPFCKEITTYLKKESLELLNPILDSL